MFSAFIIVEYQLFTISFFYQNHAENNYEFWTLYLTGWGWRVKNLDKSIKYHAENIMDFEHATLIKQIKNEGEVIAKATLIKRS